MTKSKVTEIFIVRYVTLDGLYKVDKLNFFEKHPPLVLKLQYTDGIGERRYKYNSVNSTSERFVGTPLVGKTSESTRRITCLDYFEIDERKENPNRRIIL